MWTNWRHNVQKAISYSESIAVILPRAVTVTWLVPLVFCTTRNSIISISVNEFGILKVLPSRWQHFDHMFLCLELSQYLYNLFLCLELSQHFSHLFLWSYHSTLITCSSVWSCHSTSVICFPCLELSPKSVLWGVTTCASLPQCMKLCHWGLMESWLRVHIFYSSDLINPLSFAFCPPVSTKAADTPCL